MVAAWDVASWLLAFMLFVTLRYDLQLPHQMWIMAFVYTLVAAGFTVIGGFLFHLYLGRSRVGSFDEATSLGLWVVTESLVMAMVFLQVPQFPRGVALVMPPLALMLMASGRWLFRSVLRESIRQRNRHAISESVPRALVYGAGNDGHDVARLVDLSPEPPYRILGFLDDDPGKRYRRFGSLRVLGRGSDLVRVAQDMGADLVIVAIRTARRDLLDRVAEQCRSIGIRFVTVPPVRERIGGRVRLGDLREFNVADLLGRRPIETNLRAIAGYVAGKAVLVEIPLGMTLAAAEAVVNAAEQAGVMLAVSHPMRFRPERRELLARVQSGEETPRHVHGRFFIHRLVNIGATGIKRHWIDNILWHHTTHLLDFGLWLLGGGDPAAAEARIRRIQSFMPGLDPNTGIPMEVCVLIETHDDQSILATGSYYARERIYDTLAVTSHDSYRLDELTATLTTGAGTAPTTTEHENAWLIAQDFIAALNEGRDPLVTGRSVLPVMRVLEHVQNEWDARHGARTIPGRPLGQLAQPLS